MLTDVYLYGQLGEKYGKHHKFDVNNAVSACKALKVNFKGFDADFRAGYYDVKIGDTPIDESMIALQNAGRAIYITPIAQGAKRGGAMKAIAGVALLAVAVYAAPMFTATLPGVGAIPLGTNFGAAALSIGGWSVSYGSLALSGGMMLLQGVSGMLTSAPKADYSNRNPVDQRASFLFNGATNRSADGTALQLAYGEFKVGTIVASAGIFVEQL